MHSFKSPDLLYVVPCNSKESKNQITKNSKGVFVGQYMEERRKIHLVSWSVICKDKKHGGLGFRHLEKLN